MSKRVRKTATRKSVAAKKKSSAGKTASAKKNPTAQKGAAGKKKTDVGKIYKTTDGFFTQNDDITKPRRVAVIKKRKDDGAVAVVKIYSAKGKKGNNYIKGVILLPEKHSSLTEPSIVGSKVYIGTKGKNGKHRPIMERDLSDTNDKLTRRERQKISRKAGGPTRKNKKTSRKKIRLWKKHFKK